MFKLGKLTDYGTLVMVFLSHTPDELHSASDIAERTGIAAPTVSKVLKLLSRGGLLESVRGNHGGYRLLHPAENISVASIIKALEGPIALTECSEDDFDCNVSSGCTVHGHWQRISGAIEDALENLSLAEMAKPYAVSAVKESVINFI